MNFAQLLMEGTREPTPAEYAGHTDIYYSVGTRMFKVTCVGTMAEVLEIAVYPAILPESQYPEDDPEVNPRDYLRLPDEDDYVWRPGKYPEDDEVEQSQNRTLRSYDAD